MTVLNILSTLLSKSPNTAAFPSLCKRVRFRKSTCEKCFEICPEKAISLDPEPTVKQGCSDCGLCQNVCPTEVFHNEFDTEEHLLNQAITLVEKKNPACEKKRLNIHCHRAEPPNGRSLYVVCLGRLTENILLGIAFMGFDEVILIKGVCSQCRLAQGDKLLANSITTARIILESLGSGEFSLRLMEKVKKAESVLSRREIFSKVSNEVRSGATSYLDRKEKGLRKVLLSRLESGGGERPPSTGRSLWRLFQRKNWEGSMVLKYSPRFPWGKIKIDEKTCSACGTCAVLCPTGAISMKLENEKELFYLNSSLCTNCSLCKEACLRKAIDFEENLRIAEMLGNKFERIASVKLNSCVVCGELTTEKGKKCPVCQKRPTWPMQINA